MLICLVNVSEDVRLGVVVDPFIGKPPVRTNFLATRRRWELLETRLGV